MYRIFDNNDGLLFLEFGEDDIIITKVQRKKENLDEEEEEEASIQNYEELHITASDENFSEEMSMFSGSVSLSSSVKQANMIGTVVNKVIATGLICSNILCYRFSNNTSKLHNTRLVSGH